MYGEYTEAGYEGQMVRQNTAYECKRSKNLLKRKEFITEEFEVVNVEEGNGNWSGYAKRFVLKMPNGTQFSSGIRGSQAKLKELLNADTPIGLLVDTLNYLMMEFQSIMDMVKGTTKNLTDRIMLY